jgi:hypothetical protein
MFSCTTEDVQQNLSITSEIDTTIATIGDIIHYSIYTSGAGDLSVKINDFEKPEAMEVRDQKLVEGKTFKMEIVFWDTGHFSIPVIDVVFLNADSTEKMVMQTDEQEIIIVSSSDPKMTGAMKPVKDPLPVSRPFELKMIMLISTLFLTLGIMAWLSIKYRKEKLLALTDNFLPQPDEIAIEKLNYLRKKSKENFDIKEFYVQISYILREYVEHSLFLKTLEMTTKDIKSLVNMLPFSDEEMKTWLALLERSDLIKYAKMMPENNIYTQDLITAEEFIQSTIPYWKRIGSPIA